MLVSALNIRILAHALDLEGFDSASVLRRCGLPAIDALDDASWVPVQAFDEMMACALEESMDSFFGLTVGSSMALVRYGAIVPLVMNMRSLRHGLEDIARFHRLLIQRPEIGLAESEGKAQMTFDAIAQSPGGVRFRTDLIMCSGINMLRFAGANAEDVHGVYFRQDPPDSGHHRYTAVFGPRLSFGAQRNCIDFHPRVLDIPFPGHDPAAYLAARTRAETALAALSTNTDLAHQLKVMLLETLPDALSITQAAQRLGTSERTLRRHLAAAGTSYARLVRDCQQMMAERMLADGQQSIKQVAAALGFSSVSCFHRAFRRWTGETPQSWRKAGLQQAGGNAA